MPDPIHRWRAHKHLFTWNDLWITIIAFLIAAVITVPITVLVFRSIKNTHSQYEKNLCQKFHKLVEINEQTSNTANKTTTALLSHITVVGFSHTQLVSFAQTYAHNSNLQIQSLHALASEGCPQ